MIRKLKWNSNVFDEIELVYEKAEANETIGKLLEQLELKALEEAKANCGLLKTDTGAHIAPEQFDGLSESDKETVIKVLAGMGLSSISQNIESATIYIRFSAQIQTVLACTFFDVLNRLEKLDGAINFLHPKWTLELQLPLGGKTGMFQWELLIMQLYPWITVKETSTNEAASGSNLSMNKNSTNKQSENKPPKEPSNRKGSGEFLQEMNSNPAFVTVLDKAKQELGRAIQKGQFSLKHQGKTLAFDQWNQLSEIERFNFILAMGNHGISVHAVICVDFAEIIPNCVAMMLLYSVWSGQGCKQIIDAGDGTDVAKLAEALTLLHNCYDKWECTIAHPVFIKIGEQGTQQSSVLNTTDENSQNKKPFWKKLFGK